MSKRAMATKQLSCKMKEERNSIVITTEILLQWHYPAHSQNTLSGTKEALCYQMNFENATYTVPHMLLPNNVHWHFQRCKKKSCRKETGLPL